MRIPRIYISTKLATGDTVELDENSFNHTVRVLRLKQGAAIILFNGEGGEFEAELSLVEKKRAEATMGQFHPTDCESPLQISLGQCISRGEKMDFTIQKAVELGVTEITPLFSERCGVKLQGDRLEKKEQHWQSVIISACEQSGRNFVPRLNATQDFEQWSRECNAEHKLILDPKGKRSLANLNPPNDKLLLVMGPEGGLSDNEIAYAVKQGFVGIQLGPRILRTETAALATLSAIQTLWGDFNPPQ